MANLLGLNKAATLVPYTTEDIHAIAHQKHVRGGWHSGYASIAERDAIFLDRREWNMVVVLLDGTKYELVKGASSEDLMDNANWQEFAGSGGQTLTFTDSAEIDFTQAGDEVTAELTTEVRDQLAKAGQLSPVYILGEPTQGFNSLWEAQESDFGFYGNVVLWQDFSVLNDAINLRNSSALEGNGAFIEIGPTGSLKGKQTWSNITVENYNYSNVKLSIGFIKLLNANVWGNVELTGNVSIGGNSDCIFSTITAPLGPVIITVEIGAKLTYNAATLPANVTVVDKNINQGPAAGVENVVRDGNELVVSYLGASPDVQIPLLPQVEYLTLAEFELIQSGYLVPGTVYNVSGVPKYSDTSKTLYLNDSEVALTATNNAVVSPWGLELADGSPFAPAMVYGVTQGGLFFTPVADEVV